MAELLIVQVVIHDLRPQGIEGTDQILAVGDDLNSFHETPLFRTRPAGVEESGQQASLPSCLACCSFPLILWRYIYPRSVSMLRRSPFEWIGWALSVTTARKDCTSGSIHRRFTRRSRLRPLYLKHRKGLSP